LLWRGERRRGWLERMVERRKERGGEEGFCGKKSIKSEREGRE
jgi:hypothetical protein